MENIMVSNGSACTSALVEPSHVLQAMGLNEQEAFCCLRFGVGRVNSNVDIETAITKLSNTLQNLKALA